MTFYDLFLAVFLANIAVQIVSFFGAKFYFEHMMRHWLEEDDDA